MCLQEQEGEENEQRKKERERQTSLRPNSLEESMGGIVGRLPRFNISNKSSLGTSLDTLLETSHKEELVQGFLEDFSE